MNKPKQKPIIGILGGIGSGKSTVAAGFVKLGCAVIDADKIAHNLLENKDLKKKVVARFGREILTRGGKINRRKLAKIVFTDAKKIKYLNKMIHPLVFKEVRELIKKANHQRKVKAIVLDMPLLAEVGKPQKCDKLIFVKCKRQIRVKRAKKAGILKLEKLKYREKFQISLDKKEAIADNTIDNNFGLSALTRQIIEIFSEIMGNQSLP